MQLDLFLAAVAVGCGVIVGFTLGLVGGGGSVLAVPLLLYVVGMPDHASRPSSAPARSRSRSTPSPISCRTRARAMSAGGRR